MTKGSLHRKVLFHLGHPAHFHLFKHVISKLKESNSAVFILIKKKDVLENLVRSSGWEYTNILEGGRKDSKLGIAKGMLLQDLRLFQFCRKHKPGLLIGTSFAISHVGKILGIPSINVNEDDAGVVPLYARMAYPWASVILSPTACSNGKWEHKTIHYQGYHELAYLHPNHFSPDAEIVKKYIPAKTTYCLLRFAKLTAHHDEGVSGISDELAMRLIERLRPHMQVVITSERPLSPELEPYRLAVSPEDMHDVMGFARLYIGDSQTMAAEAGVLGIPYIRYNDFVGRIGYLEEMENHYQLGRGIKPGNEQVLLEAVEELIMNENLANHWQQKRQQMLSEKIDFSKFMVWFIQQYPGSVQIFRDNPKNPRIPG